MLVLTLLLCADLPAPIGRVSDFAHVLSPTTLNVLDHELAAEEEKTSNQIVVVTVPSLDGQSIEDLAIAYGKAWHVGQKGKDNGVVFLIAPSERKMRIEVGKGLEGALTDLQSHVIQDEVVRPAFKRGDFDVGAVAGTRAIVKTIAGEFVAPPRTAGEDHSGAFSLFFVTLFLWPIGLFVLIFWLVRRKMSRSSSARINAFSSNTDTSSDSSSSNSSTSDSSSSSDSSFSGGGGDFGGGGASGDW